MLGSLNPDSAHRRRSLLPAKARPSAWLNTRPMSVGDPRAKPLFRQGKAEILRPRSLPASVLDPMTSPTAEIPPSVGEVVVDQGLSSALYLLYTAKTCQRFGLLGVAIERTSTPLSSGLFGERDRLVRVRREHTATSLPQRTGRTGTGASLAGWRVKFFSPNERLRKRFRAPRALNVELERDRVRYGSVELHGSRCRTRLSRPGEETA
jgi:hypothetical protein